MKKIIAYKETNKKIRTIELLFLIVTVFVSLASLTIGLININKQCNELHYLDCVTMQRDYSLEDYDEDCTICEVTYQNENGKIVVEYDYDEYINLQQDKIKAYRFVSDENIDLYFDHKDLTNDEITETFKNTMLDKMNNVFNLSLASLILSISICVIYFFGNIFTTYEKSWFISIMLLATIFAILMPEDSSSGINGVVVMFLYLLDTFLNILCELLISKQSRYNFLVSVSVELTEILICIVLMYRFATMATTLFFWLPIDIISFVNWSKHKDDKQDELTVVRKLKGYQEVLVIVGIIVFTVVVGYFLSGLDIESNLLHDDIIETIIIYLDACASAVGIANGLFIFFRLREQWIAWYICAALETTINILSGQYVLLILKLGYFTNTTYGYIKWNKYIESHKMNATL